MSSGDVEPVLRKLTFNAGITLKCLKTVEVGGSLGRVHTGLGKYTSLAAGGVINNLRVNGLVEDGNIPRLTPLGVEVAIYLAAHWDEVYPLLRDPRRRL